MADGNDSAHWCGRLFDEQAAQLILYGRALGLSHGEAEDVIQETFLALMQLQAPPAKARHYCMRAFRNRALNYRRRSLWRRLTREWESLRWFEKIRMKRFEYRTGCHALPGRTAGGTARGHRIKATVWQGCTFEEIGGLLDISPNTAAGRYRYGIQKIKSKLEGVAYETGERESIAFLATARVLSRQHLNTASCNWPAATKYRPRGGLLELRCANDGLRLVDLDGVQP